MSTTVAAVAEVPMKEQAEVQELAGDMTGSAAAVAGGITVPHGSGVSHRAQNADHKPPLLHSGLPRSPLSNHARMKVRRSRQSI